MGALNAADLCRRAVLALAALSLAACASEGPRYPMAGRHYSSGYGVPAQEEAKPPSHYTGPRTGTAKPYQIDGRWYYPAEQPNYDEIGTASWYGEKFHNHYTADGEVFDMNVPTAAHKTLPLPCLVEVTNLQNGRKMVVRVNDRGPFVGDRLIDMSREAAMELGFYGKGVTQVRVRYVGPAPDLPGGVTLYQATDRGPPPARPKSDPIPSQPKPRPDAPVQVATAGALLGAEIDARPIQDSPSSMSWNAAAPTSKPPAPPAPARIEEAALAPAPSAPSSDIDSLLDELANAPPSAAPAQASTGTVQAGAFSSRANAERAAAALDGRT